jgi:hypothetical protein
MIMTKTKWFSSAAVGFALAAAAGFTTKVSADTTNLLANTTFDADGPAGWAYGYFYGDNGLGVYEPVDRAYYEPQDTDQTNAVCRFAFDLSALTGNNNFGVGFGGPQFQPNADPALFVSTNREDYIFSFDARVEGLRPDRTTGNATMQVQFMNDAQTPHNILQVNLPFTPGANWTRFTFHLDEGSLGSDTSDKTFTQGRDGITSLQFNVDLYGPSDAFGFDADNAVLLDNLTLNVVARDASTNTAPTSVASTIVDWNFDNKPINYSYQYAWTEHGSQPTMSADISAPGEGVDGSNAWVLHMDNSALAGDVPAWAGGGTGGEGPTDFSGFQSPDLNSYRLSFDARALGLAPDQTQATAALQMFLRGPDDTIQPSDTDTNLDLIVQLNFPLTGLNPDWQNFTYTLNQGAIAGGSKTNFTAWFNKISQLQTQWQIESAASEATWGFDSNNALAIDNFKLERIATGCPPLTINKQGAQLVMTWSAPSSGTAKLQSGTSVNGPFTDVSGAASPYTVPSSGALKFYRTVWVP